MSYTDGSRIQSNEWSDQYTTLCYLVAIMGILSVSFLPRAKFLQMMAFSTLFICTAAALSLLMIQCCVSARQSDDAVSAPSTTGSSGTRQTPRYSASASVVAAAWMFFYIYLANVAKASRVVLLLPAIQFSIFILVTSVYAPTFPNMDTGMAYVKRLLKSFLTGFALATGVNLFIIPITSRTVLSKQLGALIVATQNGLRTHGEYVGAATAAHQDNFQNTDANVKAALLRANVQTIINLHGQVKLELPYAKREIGFGKLTPEHYTEIVGSLQHILLPVLGLSTLLDIMQLVGRRRIRRDKNFASDDVLHAARQLEGSEWDEIVSVYRPQFLQLKYALIQGLDHYAITLGLVLKPKSKQSDPEARSAPSPGENIFAKHLEDEIQKLQQSYHGTTREWSTNKGINLPTGFWGPTGNSNTKDSTNTDEMIRKAQNQHQLYLLLYMQYLTASASSAILDAVRYADELRANGTMARNRLILPGWRRIWKLIYSVIAPEDKSTSLPEPAPTGTTAGINTTFIARKDPEHLQPTNVYEHITDHMRRSYSILGSPASLFGLRAACATMSLGMLAYFRQTHVFFLQQRGFWATVMIAISLEVTAGRGLFGFVTKIAGTVVAAVVSIAIWYMSDHHAAAIVPLCYIFFALCIGFMVKNPSMIIMGMISMATVALIVGYELQERKIGYQLTVSNGQEYHHVYNLAAYRLASVCAGIGTAAFWTYFPYPITQHGALRRDTGQALYLLAEYYACVDATMRTRLNDPRQALEENIKGTPMHSLAKARKRAWDKTILILGNLDQHLQFLKFEPDFGGRFPRQAYADLVQRMDRLFTYMSIMSYSSASFAGEDGNGTATSEGANSASAATSPGKSVDPQEKDRWLHDFRAFAATRPFSHPSTTSSLCLAAASLVNAQPLPPNVHLPGAASTAGTAESGRFAEQEAREEEILSVKHIENPCYAAFAVLEVASGLVAEEVRGVVESVKELCGEVGFGVGNGAVRGLGQRMGA
ncbi:uncharacterized protein HMPREF1541_09897 [Cyphellophora europaea CBS 101466]|uniref:Uncharacterized protein n=1 Tax=Cyphellophora europaea (strain CBS 101466) TaxID=1220924 RepID=W2S8I5_CYPE1|nr:uncharacterized protein HMPREF1541_09897 [Cyphellophora europaea CBS 101466]ETN45021.1 hypothetical protein HMPREF1541_09897 [Cyphellophora europaea CBS 101466]